MTRSLRLWLLVVLGLAATTLATPAGAHEMSMA